MKDINGHEPSDYKTSVSNSANGSLEYKAIEKLMLDGCLDTAKKLKALEIIKNKGIDIIILKAHKKAKTYNEHAKFAYCKSYTDEEFDLLKEVME